MLWFVHNLYHMQLTQPLGQHLNQLTLCSVRRVVWSRAWMGWQCQLLCKFPTLILKSMVMSWTCKDELTGGTLSSATLVWGWGDCMSGESQSLTKEETLGVKVNTWKVDPSASRWCGFPYSLQDNPEFQQVVLSSSLPRLLLSSQMGTHCNLLCRRNTKRFWTPTTKCICGGEGQGDSKRGGQQNTYHCSSFSQSPY